MHISKIHPTNLAHIRAGTMFTICFVCVLYVHQWSVTDDDDSMAVEGFTDYGCSSNESMLFDSLEELEAFNGREDEDGVTWNFNSYIYVDYPDDCLDWIDEEVYVSPPPNLPIDGSDLDPFDLWELPIHVAPLPLPDPVGWTPSNEDQDALNSCNKWWREIASAYGWTAHNFDTVIILEGDSSTAPGTLGETMSNGLIFIYKENIQDYARSEGLNAKHVTWQVSIHEDYHAIQGGVLKMIWEEIVEEIEAQRKDYEWYTAIFNSIEPPFRPPTDAELDEIYDADWDTNTKRYSELYKNKNRSQAEQTEFDTLEDYFVEKRRSNILKAKKNIGRYKKNQVLSCPAVE